MKITTNRIPKLARIYMGSILVFVDIFAILLAFSTATVFWNSIKRDLIYSQYVALIPLLILFIIGFAIMDLYPAIGLSPISESRAIYVSTTTVFLILGALTFIVKNMGQYSRGVFFLSWILWGDPVVIIGYSDRSRELVQQLIQHPEFGFTPYTILDFSAMEEHEQHYQGIPVLRVQGELKINELGKFSNIQTAIVVTSVSNQLQVNQFLKTGQFLFSRVIMIPAGELTNLWVSPFNIGGVLGFELKQNLLSTPHRLIKRFMDLAIVLISSPIVLVLGILIAFIVKIDSEGPVFFREQRIGYDGEPFYVWKFRTMVSNANEQLKTFLQNEPELALEWEQNHKLKNDPRITGIGKFLRRFSLDELPQLFNILLNQMSLVGPRPIVEEEICKYGDRIELYKKVKPGLTGLWQVSGRNDLTYENRVDLDEYYVRNYSFWTDIYVLRKTIIAVLSNRGAY